ncbi:MAG: hypothetical protein ACQESF_02505 [Nanobdellota archaeon]
MDETINERNLEKIVKGAFSPVKISKYALEKSNYIAKRVSELYSEPIEVMFYLTNDKNNSEDVITDAHINFDQYLKHTYCFPTPAGKRKTIEEVEKQNKKVIGHGHSHADMSVFYSPDDHAMFKKLSNQLGNYKTITQNKNPKSKKLLNFLSNKDQNNKENYEPSEYNSLSVKRLYGMTFNQRNNTPYTCLGIRHNGNYSFHKITHEVIPTNKRFTSADKEEIDSQLKERVDVLARKYNKSYKSPGNSQKKPNPGKAIPIYNNQQKKNYSGAKEKEDRKPVTFKRSNSNIEDKVTKLEKQYQALQNNYNQLKTEYNTLRKDYKNLQQDYWATLANKGTYRQNLSAFYNTNSSNMAGKISKILLGEYRSNLEDIKNGKLQESPEETRLWSWRKRLKALEEISNQYNSVLNEREKDYLKQVCQSSTYLKRKYPFRIDKVVDLLDKL